MLQRLLLLLLVIGLSLPAMAMTGHCANAAPAAHGHHEAGHHNAPSKGGAMNDCIGCVTPPLDARPRFSSPITAPAHHTLTNDASRIAGALQPATPPPRT